MDLNLVDFVLLVLLGSGALVLLFTVISRTSRRGAECRSLTRRVICRLCQHAFESTSPEKIVPCPHCGAANEHGRSRRPG